MKKYWIPALFYDEQNNIIEGEIGTDGLVIKLSLEEAKRFLVRFVPDKRGYAWYFNETKDRIIAELVDKDTVVANPQLLWSNGFKIIN